MYKIGLTYFNPRSPRGGATWQRFSAYICRAISIHAPHEGERLDRVLEHDSNDLFQSTLPTRGSDKLSGIAEGFELPISIHAPHEGERHFAVIARAQNQTFQSTLPTRGSDKPVKLVWVVYPQFQSTLPTRGSDLSAYNPIDNAVRISIHAPHEGERRLPDAYRRCVRHHFNPRSPRGGATRMACGQLRTGRHFNPRSPRGGATRA